MRILFIQEETTTWREARKATYSYQHADALRRLGHEVVVTNAFFARHLRAARGRGPRFDQLWINLWASPITDAHWAEWAAELAPVRVGFLQESLNYSWAELAGIPYLGILRGYFERRRPYLTHFLGIDEVDVVENRQRGLPSGWFNASVPSEAFDLARGTEVSEGLYFAGTPYGERRRWLEDPRLRPYLQALPSPEQGSPLPALFDALQLATRVASHRAWPGLGQVETLYHAACRGLRRRAFRSWLRALAGLGAVVSLPHLVKALPGRVFEAMAVGRPVVSWLPPERPHTAALLENGHEILFYQSVDELLEILQRLRSDRAWRERVGQAGRQRARAQHTTEQRMREALRWLESGEGLTWPAAEGVVRNAPHGEQQGA